jgi:hypothetical protein
LKFEIKDFFLAFFFALLGFLLTTKAFISFWRGLNPLVALGFNTLLFFIVILIFGSLDLIVLKLNFGKFDRILGMLLITLVIYLVFGWSSCLYQNQTPSVLASQNATQTMNNVSSCVAPASFDGVIYWAITRVIAPTNNIAYQASRLITYVLLPFLLALLAGLMLKKPPEITPT